MLGLSLVVAALADPCPRIGQALDEAKGAIRSDDLEAADAAWGS